MKFFNELTDAELKQLYCVLFSDFDPNYVIVDRRYQDSIINGDRYIRLYTESGGYEAFFYIDTGEIQTAEYMAYSPFAFARLGQEFNLIYLNQ